MKEKFIQEISNAMAELLDIEQIAALNGVLLQVVSKYTISSDDEKTHESSASNDRLLEMFLSAKQVSQVLRSNNQTAFQEDVKESCELHH